MGDYWVSQAQVPYLKRKIISQVPPFWIKRKLVIVPKNISALLNISRDWDKYPKGLLVYEPFILPLKKILGYFRVRGFKMDFLLRDLYLIHPLKITPEFASVFSSGLRGSKKPFICQREMESLVKTKGKILLSFQPDRFSFSISSPIRSQFCRIRLEGKGSVLSMPLLKKGTVEFPQGVGIREGEYRAYLQCLGMNLFPLGKFFLPGREGIGFSFLSDEIRIFPPSRQGVKPRRGLPLGRKLRIYNLPREGRLRLAVLSPLDFYFMLWTYPYQQELCINKDCRKIHTGRNVIEYTLGKEREIVLTTRYIYFFKAADHYGTSMFARTGALLKKLVVLSKGKKRIIKPFLKVEVR